MSGHRRILALDAARGFAMLGVCLSHSRLGLLEQDPAAVAILGITGMFASPTFILVSGMLLGYLTASAGPDDSRLRQRLIDRGLFLLVVAHTLIALLHHRLIHSWGDVLRITFMTDTIGVSLIAGTLVIRSTNGRQRLALAAVLYLVSWVLVLAWLPVTPWLALIKETLVGSTDRYATVQQNFPFIPWFAVFIAATPLGELIARRPADGALQRLGRRMIVAGLVAIVVGLVVKMAYYLARPVAWASPADMPPFWRDVYEMTTPFDKYPPGPTYLLAYGGLALMLVGGVLLASLRGWAPRALQAAAVVGRASLFVFIAQYFVYIVVVPRIARPNRLATAAVFLGSISVLWIAAWLWGRIEGNRYFTVGLRAWSERAPVPRALSPG